ncbi:MAG TPA: capsule assembly Wzi family protein, partial [Longimicrobiales bacterium]|nr:capsule assembly Wzi family protein [Longimicrobiales bacterium]
MTPRSGAALASGAVLALMVIWLVATPRQATAQTPEQAPGRAPAPAGAIEDGTQREIPPAPPASVFVPAGHWSLDAARRLHGMGLIPGYDPLLEAQYAHELAAAFARAAASGTGPGRALAAGYHARFLEEWGPVVVADGDVAAMARVEVGARRLTGRLLAGRGLPGADDWLGPVQAEDMAGPWVGGAGYLRANRVAVAGRWSTDERGAPTPVAYGLVGLGPVGVWGGFRNGGLGAGPAAGLVLTRLAPRPGAGVQLMRPVTLPWVFRHLGPVRFSTAFYRMDRNGDFRNPWLWETRGTIEPHPRLQLGVSRGIMFGGEGNYEATLQRVAYMLVGKHSGWFDDQIIAVTAQYRVPVDVPLVTYLRWGFEDSAGAVRDVPGVVLGVESPAVPGLPALALGLVRTSIARSCCGNPIWYRNHAFRGGWADDGEALAHPLGGHGVEWLTWGRLDLLESRLQLDGTAFYRDRGEENLYAPAREGGSVGGSLRATLLG